jgi:hypothetical protein
VQPGLEQHRAMRRSFALDTPTSLNFVIAAPPRSVTTAAMQTTAMRATRSAYSTSDAPRSVLPTRARTTSERV